ncbi:PD-(D/E)XK nuclease superfamily protein [Magnetovibrio sp. PR-2]|uniref:PD-(D/E)XK nuclease superfamily protein n=1 Tax=Magnetovibrio sp. PR-2 TaxID=3120356 RepID=UPI002FCE3CC9
MFALWFPIRLVYLFENAQHRYPESHVVLVVDGTGWRDGAIAWLRQKAAYHAQSKSMTDSKVIEVMNYQDFKTWALRFAD